MVELIGFDSACQLTVHLIDLLYAPLLPPIV
jgi:hypothetical protein